MIDGFLRGYERTIALVADVTLWLCVAALVAAVSLNGIEIVARYFFGDSSLYRVEISLELCTALYLVGYLVLLARDEDVRVEYFYERMPPRARLAIDVAIAGGTAWFFAQLSASAFAYYRLTSTMMHPTFPISRGITTLPVLIAAGGCLWVTVYRLLASLRGIVTGWNPGGRGAPLA